ncbi:MAG: type IV pilus assembly protein PilE [Flavobacteriales bacterium]|jgi:type IV pilus assembly protein PilE
MKRTISHGFTLIELMIVIAILGVLAAYAYTSYINSVQKSRRSDAMDALLNKATLQERWYMASNQYTGDIDDVGGAESQKEYYTITVDNTTDCSSVGACFTLTATAIDAQTDDTDCLTMSVNNFGQRTATTANCW